MSTLKYSLKKKPILGTAVSRAKYSRAALTSFATTRYTCLAMTLRFLSKCRSCIPCSLSLPHSHSHGRVRGASCRPRLSLGFLVLLIVDGRKCAGGDGGQHELLQDFFKNLLILKDRAASPGAISGKPSPGASASGIRRRSWMQATGWRMGSRMRVRIWPLASRVPIR